MMMAQVRTITVEEMETLDYWERADNIEGYICSRILHLSQKGWSKSDIATAMGIEETLVRQVIIDFNLGGIAAIAPKPK